MLSLAMILTPTRPLSLIYARAENYCIGCDGDLPWQLPDEFAHFTRTTAGGAVIMGRKTYQDHNSYLSGRVNIVVSRNEALRLAPNVQRAESLPAAITLAEQGDCDIFVIGGSGLFREAFPRVHTVYETVVHADIGGDTFVDHFDFTAWHTQVLEQHPADGAHAWAFTIYQHTRLTG